MARGDHVYARRGRRYTHHGIDCGDDTVIHYVGPRGSPRVVGRTGFHEFAAGSEVRVRTYDTRVDAETAVRNAESRLGSHGYHLVRHNCEHFAAWCCTGRAASRQVRRWMLAAHGTVVSLLATETMGVHGLVVGTAGAGMIALARPRRGRRSR